MKTLTYLIMFHCITFVPGCAKKTKFARESKQPPQEANVEKSTPGATSDVKDINLSCDQAKNTPSINLEKTGSQDQLYRIKGEICANPENQFQSSELYILFVIDISGSMGKNDPYVNNTCGRYQSIQTIMNKTKDKITGDSNVQLGVVKFHDNAAISTEIQILNELQPINPKEVCDSASDTNYKAAFERAQKMLSQKSGKKMIYFITDGLPTDQNAGIQGATSLKTAIKDMDMYMIYLNQDNNTFEIAKKYLTQLVGNEDKVKLVNEANQLAPEIEKIEIPDIKINQPIIQIENQNQKNNIILKEFSQVSEDRWSFQTDSFTLFGLENTTTENSIIIKTQGSESNIEIQINIDYTLEK